MSATGDFAELAERFCSLIEQASRADPLRFLARIQEILSELYATASALPDLTPESEQPADVQMTSAEWETRFTQLRELLGSYDQYEYESYERSVADDLLDVYRDLGKGLGAMRSGASPADVIWEWRFGFQTHWAAHAEGALFAIRQILNRPSN